MTNRASFACYFIYNIFSVYKIYCVKSAFLLTDTAVCTFIIIYYSCFSADKFMFLSVFGRKEQMQICSVNITVRNNSFFLCKSAYGCCNCCFAGTAFPAHYYNFFHVCCPSALSIIVSSICLNSTSISSTAFDTMPPDA